ncbi:MORN repeat-containing protein 3 [Scaptodrosophila lebanonensis]|uniref:MORN repeat-containing protein 3 n=1 Tax=Drosophila lebanonensis TaxID=7225 RepID=A0A6J2UEL2_DROLE|nr:MORN repeat-containing protein 3 [Scaptodrosophila lebanonensis]
MSCRTNVSGVRCFRYPSGGRYEGKWLNNRHHNYGVKTSKRGLIYEGEWRNGERHGYGTLRRLCPDGRAQRIYVGQWQQNERWGEGKQFYNDGSVYFGRWRQNMRHGLGIKWYADGRIYVGQWAQDKMHGLGVLYNVNGNRYEGVFEHGEKSGEGTYYHYLGRETCVQRGIWTHNCCTNSFIDVTVKQERNLFQEHATQNHDEVCL